MKRDKILEEAKKLGAVFDIYENPRTHEYTQIPRPWISTNTLQEGY